MARVWAESQHSGTHLLMLLAIADFADDHGRAYPAVSTLAEKCRMQPRNANVILAALRASGELNVKLGQGPRGTNLYRINLQAEGVQRLAGVQEHAGVQGLASTPAKACSPPCKGLPETPAKAYSQTINEPSVNHHEPKRERAKRASRSPVKRSLPDDFAISPGVEAWAAEKGFGDLASHLEAFKEKARANGYQYADWDSAFMGAIRNDWAGLRNGKAGTKAPRNFEGKDYSAGVRDGRIV
jgi:hypothetical protein